MIAREGAVYRASDISRKAREVLEGAKSGGVRIADKDGVSLLVVRESDVRAVEASQERLQLVVDAHELLMALSGVAEDQPIASDAFRWVNRLDVADRAEFQAELRGALDDIRVRGDYDALAVMLGEWEITAGLPYDPEYLAILQGGYRPEDWVEVERPS